MCAFKPRRGPLQSTPANASAHDRPYVSRPSRSQQLRNPKLVPELTGAIEPPPNKKGIAAAILAEREVQHAKELEDENLEETLKHPPKRLEPAVGYLHATGEILNRRTVVVDEITVDLLAAALRRTNLHIRRHHAGGAARNRMTTIRCSVATAAARRVMTVGILHLRVARMA
ncbi:hypothetical protein L249_1454 [Ophiocordyceps polyrhachis-furcata BCC 54312]|uniref:Uncharacterized protein n=1 Tax=Ophiocordyceps polyrhachis-furcata BCC 54312 TaxID=1330021 RepID=A0A367L4F5_9HYPO|nr:hypothetical protein L249_1454 [Ophiocordyceps polyrhachis-furcata BCC 54312]